MGLLTEGQISGGGLISSMEKAFRNEPRSCRLKCVFKLKSQNKEPFSNRGGLISGGGGGGGGVF